MLQKIINKMLHSIKFNEMVKFFQHLFLWHIISVLQLLSVSSKEGLKLRI